MNLTHLARYMANPNAAAIYGIFRYTILCKIAHNVLPPFNDRVYWSLLDKCRALDSSGARVCLVTEGTNL